jgi:hypothetical protein
MSPLKGRRLFGYMIFLRADERTMSERVVTLTGNVGSTARNGMVVEGPQTLQPWSTFLGGGDDDEPMTTLPFCGADEPERTKTCSRLKGPVQPFLPRMTREAKLWSISPPSLLFQSRP